MSQYAFFVNVDKCTACRACLAACKDKHNLPPGRKFRRLFTCAGGGWTTDTPPKPINPYAYTLSIGCNHCQDPACKKSCPFGAIGKRESDGVVFIDQSLCAGCKTCATACPYGVPSYRADTNKMEKCDMCRDLLANGEKPACVAACTMRCLEIGEYSNLESVYGVHTPVPLPDSSQTKPSLIVVPHRFAKADAHLISMPEESVASDQL